MVYYCHRRFSFRLIKSRYANVLYIKNNLLKVKKLKKIYINFNLTEFTKN